MARTNSCRSGTTPRWPTRSSSRGSDSGRRTARSRLRTRWGRCRPASPRPKGRPKAYILDFFPYPSGAGLHVGHPLGYIGTDVLCRFLRMTGHTVLHTFGYDAFGLPAEQYAISTGQHPAVSTRNNIDNMRWQLLRLGLGYDTRREFATTDPRFYRWTQWIFLQIFNSWFDEDRQRARPIAELVAEFEAGTRVPSGPANPGGRPWAELDELTRRKVVDGWRLAYRPRRWSTGRPGLGTVLANEEVTADGRSDVGNYPVYRRPLRQWLLRITAYADRLLADLDGLDWPEPIKQQQRNWIGPSDGAIITFPVAAGEAWGSMCSPPGRTRCPAPPTWCWPPSIRSRGAALRHRRRHRRRRGAVAPTRSAPRRSATGSGWPAATRPACSPARYAVNPATGEQIPVFLADYVLMGYGTGAIMAVPADDERDREFAESLGLPVTGLRAARRPHRLAGAHRPRPPPAQLPAAGLAVLPAAVLGRAVPDRLRLRRPAGRAARGPAAGHAAGDDRLRGRVAQGDRDSAEPVPPLARAGGLGATSSSTWVTAARSTGAS